MAEIEVISQSLLQQSREKSCLLAWRALLGLMQPEVHLAPSSARYFMQIVERGLRSAWVRAHREHRHAAAGDQAAHSSSAPRRSCSAIGDGEQMAAASSGGVPNLYHDTLQLFVQSHLMSCHTQLCSSLTIAGHSSLGLAQALRVYRWWLSYIHLSFFCLMDRSTCQLQSAMLSAGVRGRG